MLMYSRTYKTCLCFCSEPAKYW